MQKLAAFLKRFHSGPAADACEYLGCHTREDGEGYVFRVWAPHAQAVSVVGDFNFWNTADLPMRKISDGVWEAVSVYAKAWSTRLTPTGTAAARCRRRPA